MWLGDRFSAFWTQEIIASFNQQANTCSERDACRTWVVTISVLESTIGRFRSPLEPRSMSDIILVTCELGFSFIPQFIPTLQIHMARKFHKSPPHAHNVSSDRNSSVSCCLSIHLEQPNLTLDGLSANYHMRGHT